MCRFHALTGGERAESDIVHKCALCPHGQRATECKAKTKQETCGDALFHVSGFASAVGSEEDIMDATTDEESDVGAVQVEHMNVEESSGDDCLGSALRITPCQIVIDYSDQANEVQTQTPSTCCSKKFKTFEFKRRRVLEVAAVPQKESTTSRVVRL